MESIRPLSGPMRAIFWVGGAFVLVASIQLYLLSAHTDDWFAWTIQPPLTAALMGAFYFNAFVIAIASARERDWDRSRVGVPGITVFVWVVLAATLLHLDKFHHDDGQLIPAVAAWAWLVVYVVEPPVLVWAYRRQLRAPGGDAPCDRDVPGWFRALYGALGALMSVVAAVLFIAPDSADWLWPWELTPLTARAISATLAAEGIMLITAASEPCWARIRWGVAGALSMAFLVGIALARYPGTFEWESASGVCFLAVLAGLLAGSLWGLLAVRRAGAL